MKNYRLLILQLMMFLFPLCSFAGNIYSFENDIIPNEFSATNGTLSISKSKYKLGDKSLSWQWNANSILSVNKLANLAEACKINDGGINVWVYNTQENAEPLQFVFYDASGTERCRINFNLNFKGWRCLTATFRYDMGFNKATSTLDNLKIFAPKSNNGTLYIDYLEFTNKISWERISDFQYNLNQTNYNIVSFLDIRNTPSPSPIPPTGEQTTAFSTIEKRLNEWYLGTGKFASDASYKQRERALNTYINSAKNKINTLNLVKEADGTVTGPGLYPVTYQGVKVEGTSVNTFRNVGETFLIQLAYDYRRTKNQTSLNTVLDILNWYNDQGWADGSALGSLRFEMLRSSGFYNSLWLIKDELNNEQFNQAMDATRWHTMFGTAYNLPDTPGELADYMRSLAIPKLFYALSIKNEAERNTAMQAYQAYAKNALGKAPGFKGTMKPDYSGYHHNGPYYSAYYPDALYTGSLIYYLLHGTPYDLGEETYNDLKTALLTFRFMCGEYNVPAATTGRFPAQQTILHQLLPAFAYLGLSKDTPDAELVSAFKRLWKPNEEPIYSYMQRVRTDITFTSSLGEVEALLEFNAKNGSAEVNPTGTHFMPYSGLLIARQPEWLITAKGMSKYIWDYESSGSENIYGRYLSNAQLEFTDLDNNNSSYNPKHADWNWNHIPGTTSKFLSYTNLDYNKTNGKHRNLSDKTFLGGIALNDNLAMFTNQVHDNAIDNSFYADKSTFVFDNLIYCLGSGINSKSTTTPVYTTLFQNTLSTDYNSVSINNDAYTSDLLGISNPVIKDNYGNAFIVQDGNVNVTKNGAMMLAYIDHGKVISDKKYAYAWLMKPTEEQVTSYTNDMPISILSQNATAHAVYHKEKKVMALSVFAAENPINIREVYSVSTPMLVMIREDNNMLDLAFSDPDMKRDSAPRGDDITPAIANQKGEVSEITVILNGAYEKAEGDQNISVETQDDKTIVKYPYAKDGETYKVKLKKDGTSIGEVESNDKKVFVRTEGDYIVIESNLDEQFNCQIFDLVGRPIYSQTDIHQSTRISKVNLPSNILIIKVTNNNFNRDFKLINNN